MMSKGMDAYHRGTVAAIALTEGDTFRGALSAATIEGFLFDPNRRDFVAGYVNVVQARWPGGIVIDADGRIVPNTFEELVDLVRFAVGARATRFPVRSAEL